MYVCIHIYIYIRNQPPGNFGAALAHFEPPRQINFETSLDRPEVIGHTSPSSRHHQAAPGKSCLTCATHHTPPPTSTSPPVQFRLPGHANGAIARRPLQLTEGRRHLTEGLLELLSAHKSSTPPAPSPLENPAQHSPSMACHLIRSSTRRAAGTPDVWLSQGSFEPIQTAASIQDDPEKRQ